MNLVLDIIEDYIRRSDALRQLNQMGKEFMQNEGAVALLAHDVYHITKKALEGGEDE